MRTLTRRQQLATVTLTVVALVFISLDFSGGSLRAAHGGTTGLLGSLYRGTDGVLGPIRRFVQGVPDVGSNRETIARLQAQNDALHKQLTDDAVNQNTAAQLKALQLQADSMHLPVLPARVIATGPGAGFQWTVTVDIGSTAGVLRGQTVTAGSGLVGRVLSVQAATSVVLLVSDPTAAVGVRDLRSGALLLTVGAGSTGLRAGSLTSGADVKVGDQLVTGPAGSTTYVAGLAVGTVTGAHRGTDGLLSAEVRVTAAQTDLNLLGIVLAPAPAGPRPALTPAAG